MAYIVLNHSQNTGFLTITLHANQKPFHFIIDTGSNVSHIDTAAAGLLNNPKTSFHNPMIIGISGSLKSTGTIHQIFTNDIFTFEHDFLVSDLSALFSSIQEEEDFTIHGIIGTDFLSKYRCHIDFKKNRLHLG